MRPIDADALFQSFENAKWNDNGDSDIAEDILLSAQTIEPPVVQWISVEDRLPETSGEYLIHTENGDIFKAAFDECCGDSGEFGMWQACYDAQTLGYVDSEWTTLEGVTHWMPLPQPPKEEAE